MNKKIIGLLWVGAVLSGGGCVMSTPEAKNTVVTPKTHMATKPKVARQPKYKSVADKITHSMDPVDQFKTNQALENASTGQATNWVNPTSGSRYTITPDRTFERGNDKCRDYQINAIIQGQQHSVQVTACRDLVGHWRQQAR